MKPVLIPPVVSCHFGLRFVDQKQRREGGMGAPVSAAYLFIMFARRRQFSSRRLSSRKEAKRGHPCGAHYAAILGCAAVKDSYVTNFFAGHAVNLCSKRHAYAAVEFPKTAVRNFLRRSGVFCTGTVCCHTAIFEKRGLVRGHFSFQQETG